MPLTGKQRAAMLLISLDVPTAVELLKSIDPETVQELALELAYLDTINYRVSGESLELAKQFYSALQAGKGFHLKSFLKEILQRTMGKEEAEQFHSQIKKAAKKRDPFVAIRLASIDELVFALEAEDPQTCAVVLSELSPRKSQEILSLLDKDVRTKAVCRMTNLKQVGPEVRRRIASIVNERLEAFGGETLPERQEQALRKLALVLSGLKGDLRDQLLDEVSKRNKETFTMLRNLMITWEDIPTIAGRSLQEVLRTVSPGKLALALRGADEAIVMKIRSNISERAAAVLDEEISLMQEPLEEEVLDAREEIVGPLREANEKGTLRLVGR